MRKQKIYLASPFFNSEQLARIEQIEKLIVKEGWVLFSPRLADSASKMNKMIREGDIVPDELRRAVFRDNVDNIDNSDMMIAVIDERDTGVMFEMGYAFRSHVPIVTFTSHDYGVNLMLSHSVVGHAKSLEELAAVLRLGYGAISKSASTEEYGTAIAKIQFMYKSQQALLEGPNEHKAQKRS